MTAAESPIWLPIDHWTRPHDRPIMARLPDGRETAVRFHPLRQCWANDEGERVAPVEWREIDDG